MEFFIKSFWGLKPPKKILIKKIQGAHFALNQKSMSYKLCPLLLPSICMSWIFDLGPNKLPEFFLSWFFRCFLRKRASCKVWENDEISQRVNILYFAVFHWIPYFISTQKNHQTRIQNQFWKRAWYQVSVTITYMVLWTLSYKVYIHELYRDLRYIFLSGKAKSCWRFDIYSFHFKNLHLKTPNFGFWFLDPRREKVL